VFRCSTYSVVSRLFRSSILRLTTVIVIALACSSLAFCDEIHDAAQYGDLAKVKALLKDHPHLVFSKDNFGMTPLHLAALAGHRDVAVLLLANKAEVHTKVSAKVDGGMTPLHLAAINGHRDVAVLLLANKAEVDAKDNDGLTPLHRAAEMGHSDVAAVLLANKADVNAKDGSGRTPLYFAATNGYKDIAALLRQHGGHE
jgi:ankyrin repeat protein